MRRHGGGDARRRRQGRARQRRHHRHHRAQGSRGAPGAAGARGRSSRQERDGGRAVDRAADQGGQHRGATSRRSRAASRRCRARTRCCPTRAGRAPISTSWSTRSWRPTARPMRTGSALPGRRSCCEPTTAQTLALALHELAHQRREVWRAVAGVGPARSSTGTLQADALIDRTGARAAGRAAQTPTVDRLRHQDHHRQHRAPARRQGRSSTGGREGLRCTLAVPRGEQAATRADTAASERRPPTRRHDRLPARRILIVEDEALVAHDAGGSARRPWHLAWSVPAAASPDAKSRRIANDARRRHPRRQSARRTGLSGRRPARRPRAYRSCSSPATAAKASTGASRTSRSWKSRSSAKCWKSCSAAAATTRRCAAWRRPDRFADQCRRRGVPSCGAPRTSQSKPPRRRTLDQFGCQASGVGLDRRLALGIRAQAEHQPLGRFDDRLWLRRATAIMRHGPLHQLRLAEITMRRRARRQHYYGRRQSRSVERARPRALPARALGHYASRRYTSGESSACERCAQSSCRTIGSTRRCALLELQARRLEVHGGDAAVGDDLRAGDEHVAHRAVRRRIDQALDRVAQRPHRRAR